MFTKFHLKYVEYLHTVLGLVPISLKHINMIRKAQESITGLDITEGHNPLKVKIILIILPIQVCLVKATAVVQRFFCYSLV